MSSPRMPRFFSDLARDLRDRRLLLPAIALIVALIAVPVLLSSRSEPAPPPTTSAAAGNEATAVESAVITEGLGIRNYHKRLALLKRKNPFHQHYASPTKASVSIEGGNGGGGSTTSTSESDASAAASDSKVTVGGDSTTTDTTSSGATAAGTTTVDETVTEIGGQPAQPPKPEIRFYAGRVDVAVGMLGEVKKIRDVRYLDFLPSDKAPVASFISLDGAGDSAVFALSRDVVDTSGDGRCAPKIQDGCQFLTLGIGEQRTLKLADGTTYRLKLLDAKVVRIPDPRGTSPAD
jgi:hypothetical protein